MALIMYTKHEKLKLYFQNYKLTNRYTFKILDWKMVSLKGMLYLTCCKTVDFVL